MFTLLGVGRETPARPYFWWWWKGVRDTPCTSMLPLVEMYMHTLCTSILLAVETDTPCASKLLVVEMYTPYMSILLAWKGKKIHSACPYCWRRGVVVKVIHPVMEFKKNLWELGTE